MTIQVKYEPSEIKAEHFFASRKDGKVVEWGAQFIEI